MITHGEMAGQSCIDLMAGVNPEGAIVMEKILVSPQPEAGSYQLLKSPLFVRGIARGDVIQKLDKPAGAFKILRHAGNLCIRVFARQHLSALEQSLTPDIEKLGADLDINEARALVYSIHVSCGFNAIEALLNEKLKHHPDATWFYGNVYDPGSGEPLNWWHAILSPD